MVVAKDHTFVGGTEMKVFLVEVKGLEAESQVSIPFFIKLI